MIDSLKLNIGGDIGGDTYVKLKHMTFLYYRMHLLYEFRVCIL